MARERAYLTTTVVHIACPSSGAPSEATPEEGEELFDRLVTMVVTEIAENLAKRTSKTPS